MLKRFAFLLLFVLLWTLKSRGQNFRVLHWGIESGLSQGINHKIIQDSKGFLWITSYEGLNRFDGKNFRNFYSSSKKNSLHGWEITGLVEDSMRRIWAGSSEGLNCYNPETDSFIHFLPEKALLNGRFYSIPLAATKEEIICFEISGKIVAYSTDCFAKRIITDKVPWHSNYLTAINCWLNKAKEELWMPVEQGLANIHLRNGTTDIYGKSFQVNALLGNEQKQRLVIGTDSGILEFNLKSRKFLPNTYGHILKSKVTCIAKDKNQCLWIGTEEQGLYVAGADGNFNHYVKTSIQNSINGNKINSIFFDLNGTAWVGVSTNGVDQLIPENGFQHYNDAQKKSNQLSNNIVRCFLEDNEKNIWIATQGGGINIFNPSYKLFKSLTRKILPGLPSNFIRSLAWDKKGIFLIGTEKGACRLNAKSLKTKKINFCSSSSKRLASPYVEQIIPFENNSWLISTKQFGLFILNKDGHKAMQLPFPGNKHVFYTAFVNKLLFISVWDENPRIFFIKSGQWIEIESRLAKYTITWVSYDKRRKRYWIGSLQGLIETDEKLNILRQYTVEDGLSNHYIYVMVLDKNGLLWISTNKGISQFDPERRTFNKFTPEDGLQGYEYNAKAALEASDGTLYFGGINGFDAIKKSLDSLPSTHPKFYIKELLVNNIPYRSKKNINYIKALQLNYFENNITIQTGVVNFIPSGNNKIKYKLVGIDREWKIADRDFVINYSSLPSGEFEFFATAASAPGKWNPEGTHIRFFVAKPWWRSWWFFFSIFFFLLFIIVLLFRSYYQRKWIKQKAELEKVRAVEQERTRIAFDMHDDLGVGLTKIKFLSEKIELKSWQQQSIQEELLKVKRCVHDMIDKMGEIVWALNEKNDSLADLLAYSRSYAIEYLEQAEIHCCFETSDNTPSIFINGEFRRNVFLSVKEALHNVVKHAEATKVLIRVMASEKLDIFIEDDGKGFKTEEVKPYRNGVMNMQKRMVAISGKCIITSGQKTIVHLSAPLPY